MTHKMTSPHYGAKFAGKYRSSGFTPRDIARSVVVQEEHRRVTSFDRAPSRFTAAVPGETNPPSERQSFVERFGQDAWDQRELAAKEVVHTVVPLHKSNYVLVTDVTLIPGMCSKHTGK
jgi:hypothetical protein